MSGSLRKGHVLIARGMRALVEVGDLLGEGAQAEVYRARSGNSWYALKWYRREYLPADPWLWERLRTAIHNGAPTEQFLWPFDLVSANPKGDCGGYLMPLKPDDYVSLVDLLRRQSEPTFRALALVGFQLADSFLKLHLAGLCYRDINFGNIFFNPDTGDIRIADTDNVDVNQRPGSIRGTAGFMAPEVAREETEPNAMTDRFSLAVLLFHIFILGHPLKGRRELQLAYDARDPDGSRRLCAESPVFVFDPDNESNRPEPGVHDALLSFWPIYPTRIRKLFTRAFTAGLHDPDARVMENEWRKELSAMADSIFLCPSCSAENFFDVELLRSGGGPGKCWSCEKLLSNPPRMRLGKQRDFRLVVLSNGTRLYPHHLNGDVYNFNHVLAEVIGKSEGLRNLSGRPWHCRAQDGRLFGVNHDSVLRLEANCKINFGGVDGELRVESA